MVGERSDGVPDGKEGDTPATRRDLLIKTRGIQKSEALYGTEGLLTPTGGVLRVSGSLRLPQLHTSTLNLQHGPGTDGDV